MPGTHKRTPRGARKSTRQPVKVSRTAIVPIVPTLSRNAQRALMAGAAVVAAGAAATGAIVMRRRIGALATGAASEAILAGHSVGSFGRRMGKSLGREISEIDLTRLLMYAGLKRRPSLFRRLLPSVGALAALVAAGGSALFLIAPKLRANDDDTSPREEGRETKTGSPSIAKAGSIGDSATNHHSIGSSIGSSVEEIEEGISHAVK